MMKKKFTQFRKQNRLMAIFGKACIAGLFAIITAELHAENGPADSKQLNNLSLGGAVWAESDNNGMKHTRYDGVYLMDAGLIGVTVRLYADINNDGIADGPVLATQLTNNFGQYTFANLAPGHYVVGVQKPAGNFNFVSVAGMNDPDNNIDEDNNGVIRIQSGELRSLAITLTAGLEPTYDGDNANGNRTLDFAFQVMIGVNNVTGNCTIRPSTVDFARYGYAISANQFNTNYPPAYFSYAYQYRNAAGNWVCFTNGVNTINGAQVLVTQASGSSISSIPASIPVLGNIPAIQLMPANNQQVVPVSALQGLVVRCVLSLGQTADACSLPAGNTYNSGQDGPVVTKTIDFNSPGCLNTLPQSSLVGASGTPVRAAETGLPLINIYPNPAKGPVQLEFKGLRGNFMVSLYDQSGRLAASQQVTIAGELQVVALNRGRLNGNYLLQVRELSSGKVVESRQVLLK